VEITFMVYEGTLQAEALGLVAAKTRASLMIEGELPEDGLAALQGDGSDVYLALARRLAEARAGSGDDAHSLEALFAEARQSESQDDRLLVEEDWDEATDTQPGPAQVQHATDAFGPGTALPLFESTGLSAPPPQEQQTARVLTFEELATLLRRRKPRARPVPDGQLTLFES
jgi:hypothetical protein